MSTIDQFLGMVQLGRFQILSPSHAVGEAVRLTGIQMQEAVPPETREIDLTQYEGSALMVSGHYGGGWIYAARIVESAGPILTAVVMQVFGPSDLAEH
jgi:hypothetical protein